MGVFQLLTEFDGIEDVPARVNINLLIVSPRETCKDAIRLREKGFSTDPAQGVHGGQGSVHCGSWH